MRLILKFKLPSRQIPVLDNHNTRSTYLLQSIISFCFICLSATSAFSAEAKITDLVITYSQGGVLLDLRVADFFTEEMQEAVIKGIPITISFSISLYEVLDFWFDNKLVEKKEFHSIHYDVLRKEYRIQRSWEKSGSEVEKDFLKAQKCLSEIKGLGIISLSRLKKGAHYQLRVKSELYDRHFPFSGSAFGFKTDWYTVNFIY